MRNRMLLSILIIGWAIPLGIHAQSLDVTAPDGGERWILGDTHAITWSAAAVTSPVRLVLFRDTVKVGTIVSGLDAASGSYSWVTGQLIEGTAEPGDRYRVRVVTADNALSDYSRDLFTLSRRLDTSAQPPPGGDLHVNIPDLHGRAVKIFSDYSIVGVEFYKPAGVAVPTFEGKPTRVWVRILLNWNKAHPPGYGSPCVNPRLEVRLNGMMLATEPIGTARFDFKGSLRLDLPLAVPPECLRAETMIATFELMVEGICDTVAANNRKEFIYSGPGWTPYTR